jgi:alanyl-tRNA synthetase
MSFVMSAGLEQIETSLSRAPERSSNRFVLVQECFRHFDINRVGTDGTHISLFEMPAAFEFGPDGDLGIIRKLWTLATSVLGIDKNRIWVSYFKGGKVLGDYLPSDNATRQAWIDVGVPINHIIGLGPDENYWVQGVSINGQDLLRKAGPNTELFYEIGNHSTCSTDCLPGCKCGRFVEFSNTLFICSELDPDGKSQIPMEEPFVETVIGTERVAMILQGAQTVFDTDAYRSIIEIIRNYVCAPDLSDTSITAGERIIADHLKALYILVMDGAPPPGKDGRERIIKLLIRRVITQQIILGISSQDFLHNTLVSISETLNNGLNATPEDEKRVKDYFSSEKVRFLKTIQNGKQKLERMLTENQGCTLSGEQIVCLEKRWGLPHPLVGKMLLEKGVVFAEGEYAEALYIWRKTLNN